VGKEPLGQGQGPIAEAWIEKARAEGGWVVLQNCHLATSWMTTLERIAEQLGLAEAAVALQAKNGTPIPPEVGKPPAANFRLWLTAYPSPAFPVSVLQDGVKMTNEPPKGLRSNLKRSFLNDPISDAKFYNSVANADLFRRLLLALTFFHGVAQERRQYGPLGFNIPYEFNESDIRISIMQVGMFLDDPEHSAGGSADRDAAVRAVPFKHLRYLVGECNYGGRVTDGQDRQALNAILDSIFCPEVFALGHPLSPSKEWAMPGVEVREYKQYLEFIDALPAVANPEVFGLHENASLTRDQMEATKVFDSVLLTIAAGGGGGGGGGGKGKKKAKGKE
jgi:dynein heavy chain